MGQYPLGGLDQILKQLHRLPMEPGRQPRVRGRYVSNSEKLAGRALLPLG